MHIRTIADVKFDLDDNKRRIGNAKTLEKSGCPVMGDTGALTYEGRTHDNMEYEMFIPSTLVDVDIKGICLYRQLDLKWLASEQKKKLAEHQGMAMRIVQRK